uniref:TFCD_C domain-containing protein n=1 Tax=Ascaris lumbricoides TaxID=6252 RepID=A0A0M3IT32_ASCLU
MSSGYHWGAGQSEKVDATVKPAVLSCFGDVALAIGPSFSRYYEYVTNFLLMAVSTAKVEDRRRKETVEALLIALMFIKEDYDKVEYVEQLRESCIEAYTGIVQGMRTSQNELALLASQTPHMLDLVELIATSDSIEDSLVGAASGLVGDLVTSFGVAILPSVDNQHIAALLTRGRRSKTAKTKSLAMWATKEIRKLKAPAS